MTRAAQAQAELLEALLARLYTDDALRQRFLADPQAVAHRAGLDDATAAALTRIDREGLALAARSLAVRRGGPHPEPGRRPWWRRLWPGGAAPR